MLPEYPLWKKVGISTVNWIKTNERGMTFGVLFGAAFLTLLGYLRRLSFRNGYANSALGMAVGAPLGVCVNCAAPIAKGMYSGGARAKSTLSAMVASPTLNVIVLTMLFSMLPFYMAVAKIALSLFVILLAVPLLCRFLPAKELQIADTDRVRCSLPDPALPPSREGPVQAVFRFAIDFLRSLWFIVWTTVPLMLLAGFLGSLVATLLPNDLLRNVPFGFSILVLTSVVGTFLPVPIGFDVAVAGALLNGGLAPGYVMALLFTLGIFSIYSWFIVAGAISLRAALLMGALIVALGVVAGLGADAYHKWQSKRAIEILTGFNLFGVLSAHAANAEAFRVQREKGHTISVYRQPFAPRSPAAGKPFTRVEAWHLGIDRPLEFSFADMWPPFWDGRSIAAGDFNRDGNIDIVYASTEKGLYFFTGDGKGKFRRVEMPIGRVKDMPVFNAALVDIDNDGWPDLFIATFRQGNYLIRNVNGTFDVANMTPVKNRDDAVLSSALSFGDVDGDGFLDAAIGNWAAGWYRRIPGEEARSRVIFNDGGKLTGEKFLELPGPAGRNALRSCSATFNQDGKLDLLVGNDFEIPDIFYIGDGEGGLSRDQAAGRHHPDDHHDYDGDQDRRSAQYRQAGNLRGADRRPLVGGYRRSSGCVVRPVLRRHRARRRARVVPEEHRHQVLVQVGPQLRSGLCAPLPGDGWPLPGRMQGHAGEGSSDPEPRSGDLQADPGGSAARAAIVRDPLPPDPRAECAGNGRAAFRRSCAATCCWCRRTTAPTTSGGGAGARGRRLELGRQDRRRRQ